MTRSQFLKNLIVMALLFLVACTASSVNVMVVKSENDSGTTFEMNRGDTLAVVLKANPTTGYEWSVVDVDAVVLKEIDVAYERDPVSSGIVGSGGKFSARFVAKEAGRTDLRLIYSRSFEKGKPAAKSFDLVVRVKR